MKCPVCQRVCTNVRKDDGSTLIETALVLPIVLMITFGFINLCLILFNMGMVNYASRSVLRYASMHSSTSYTPLTQQELNTLVGSYILSYPANTFTVTSGYYSGGIPAINTTGNAVGSGVYITVTISYGFSFFGLTYKPISYTTTGWNAILQ